MPSLALMTTTLLLCVLPVSAAARSTIVAQARPSAATLKRAAALIEKRDLSGAETLLETMLRANPPDPRVLNLLGVVRFRQNRYAEAEDLFKRSLDAAPRLAGTHVNLGLLYLATSRAEEAVDAFEKALSIEPNRTDARERFTSAARQVAAAALSSGEPEKSLSFLLRAKKVAPADADVLFEFAMVALRMQLFDDAAPALNAALAVRPAEARFVYGLARVELHRGKLPDAERLFARYTAMQPDDATGHYGSGHVLALLKRPAEARAAFERSLEIKPQQTESQYQLGLLDLDEGNVDSAAMRFDRVLARFADHTGALLGLGQVRFRRKEYEPARASLERAIALDPSLYKAHYYLSMTYGRLGDKEAAQRASETAATLERELKEKKRTILRLADAADAKP